VIVLDTHAWIWTVTDPDKLSPAARRRVAEESTLGVSAISAWEVAMLVAKKRLGLDRGVMEWVRAALAQPGVTLLPLAPEIAVAAAGMTLHGDPSDRMIVATALQHGADLVTADSHIRRSRVVRTVW
jgi:PIN domain nuclease of toxin-antitoxin system